jgi:hypothetical protein
VAVVAVVAVVPFVAPGVLCTARAGGFEPPKSVPKTEVLPLDDARKSARS